MVFCFKARPESGDYTIFMGLDKYENEELIKYGFPEDIWFHVDKMSSAHVYLRLNKTQTIDNISEDLLEDCAQLVKANSIQGNKMNNVDVVYTPWNNLKKTPSMDVGQVSFHNPKMIYRMSLEEKELDKMRTAINHLRQLGFMVEPQQRLLSVEVILGGISQGKSIAGSKFWSGNHWKSNFTGLDTRIHYYFFGPPSGTDNNTKVRTVRVEKRINEIVNRLNKTKVERKPDLKAEREAISTAEKAERKVRLRDKKRREELERLEKEKQAEIRSYKGLMVSGKMTSNKQIASANKSLQELEEDFM